MTSRSEALLLALALAVCGLAGAARAETGSTAPAHAHAGHAATAITAPTALPFDAKTWRTLLRQGPRPAAYLFTTSYCSTCPEAFEVLERAVKTAGRPAELAAVMMDVGGAQAQRHAAYFSGLTRLYTFDGFEPAIRQSVDPQWQNITPYIVMVDRKGRLQRVIGPPDDGALKRWLQ